MEAMWFRSALGLIAVIGSLAAFGGLYFFEIPARNENALMFALGVVFSWGSSVFASEYGSSNIGRKVADSAVKRMDRGLVGSEPAPADAEQAADQMLDASKDEAAKIKGKGGG